MTIERVTMIFNSLLSFILGGLILNREAGRGQIEMKEDDSGVTEESKTRELTLSIHLTEYSSIRKESDLLIQNENRLINYGVIVIGGLVAVQQLFNQEAFLLLIGSMLFSSLGWAFAETELKIHDIGRYLRIVLIPKIQKLIAEDGISEYQVLGWSFSRNSDISRIFARGFTGVGKFLIIMIPSVFMIIIYYFEQGGGFESWDLLNKILFCSSVVMFLAIPLVIAFNLISNLVQVIRNKTLKKYFNN